MSTRNPSSILTIVALILGGLLGMVAGAYIIYAWVPTSLLFTNMAPVHLTYSGTVPQYRDVYVAHVAARYQFVLSSQRNQTSANKIAQDLLGVTTGDVKPDEAIKMVRETLAVVKSENDKDGEGGWFTKADENNVAAMLTEIQKPSTIGQTPNAVSARDNNLTWNRIIGFALLASLGVATVLAMYLLYSYLNSKVSRAPVVHTAAEQQPEAYDEQPQYEDEIEELVGQEQDYDHDEPRHAGAFTRSNPANIETTQYSHPSHGSSSRVPDGYSSIDDDLDDRNLPPTGEFNAPPIAPARANVHPAEVTHARAEAPAPRPVTQAPPANVPGSGTSTFGAPRMTSRRGETYYQTFPAIDYKHGDENLDEHHNIVGAKDLILGTCGVSVVERLGAAKPAEVIALALAVFDKTSMKTTYKVLMTPTAHSDMTIRRKLSDIGELISVQEGDTIAIETNSLLVHVKPSNLVLEKSNTSALQYFKQVSLTFDAQQRL